MGAEASASGAGMNASANRDASAEGKANGLALGTESSDRTSASLRTDETVRAIEDAASRIEIEGERYAPQQLAMVGRDAPPAASAGA